MTDTVVHRALLRLAGPDGRRWRAFENPRGSIVAQHPDEVLPALAAVDRAVAEGAWAVGFTSYDAAPAFDSAMEAHRHPDVPLVAFGLFDGPQASRGPDGSGRFAVGEWWPDWDERAHAWAVERVRDHLAAGDTYQVNLTLRLHSHFDGDPEALFAAMCRAQQADHVAFVDLGDRAVCSASPELFLRRDGEVLASKPMKGTRPRHPHPIEDARLAAELPASEKDRAENTMIVDMVRNDLGRIARTGSVRVPQLHSVEAYPTVHQMTSTVVAESDAGLEGVFRALFPAASITGAPKVAASRLIAELEVSPRGVYCGAVGFLAPDGTAEFNVAIRTAWVDRGRGRVEYGVGGGIVWDSHADEEWREVQAKSRILHRVDPDLRLLETMRCNPGEGIVLLERHLDRLTRSAAHFGFDVDIDDVAAVLAGVAADATEPLRVRLTVSASGEVHVQTVPLPEGPHPETPWRVPIARRSVRSADELLFHKTTRRAAYEAARARFPDAPEVICVNERDEVTEGTIGNVVARIGGRWVTPPVACGLLAGTLRAELLERGDVTESVIRVEDLLAAEEVHLVNSVRGRVPIHPILPEDDMTDADAPAEIEAAKVELRRRLRAERGRLDATERAARSAALWDHLAALPEYRSARTVMAYCSFGSEPDTAPLFERLWADGRRLVLPRVEGPDLAVVPHEASGELVRSALGVAEPHGEAVDPAEVDLVVLPGLAFDRHGNRMGYGAGFYDRFLAKLPDATATVGVAFTEQVVAEVPTAAWDVPVGRVLTDGGPVISEDAFDGVEYLSFDCYGTLIDWEAGILAAAVPWRERTGVALDDEGVLAAFAAEETHVQADTPGLAYPAVLEAVLQRMGERLGAAPTAEEVTRFGASVPDWPAFPDAPEALARLATRFRLVILSNIDHASFEGSARHLAGELGTGRFHAVLTAADIGSYKPDPRNFEALLAHVGAEGAGPEALVHVAQSRYHDITPATRMGLRTAWIDRRAGRPGGGATPPGGPEEPTWRYTTLAALADALDL